MNKTIFLNVLWFFLVMCIFIVSSMKRHYSTDWGAMPDVKLIYDVYFIGVFGGLFLFSSIGLLNKKIWGYKLTIATNNSLLLLGILPLLYFLFFDLENISLLSSDWKIVFLGVGISVVSATFSILIYKIQNKEYLK